MSDWVTIQSYMYPNEASLAKAKLESLGIDCFLQDELTTQVVSGFSNAMGGARLQVRSDRYQEAKDILIEGGLLKDETIHILNSDDYEDETICPFCQSENIDSMVRPKGISILIFYLLRIVFIFNRVDRCNDCAKEWKFKKLKKTNT